MHYRTVRTDDAQLVDDAFVRHLAAPAGSEDLSTTVAGSGDSGSEVATDPISAAAISTEAGSEDPSSSMPKSS